MSRRTGRCSKEPEIASAPSTLENQAPTGNVAQATIAELAYRHWIERGRPEGSAEEDWFESEKGLRSRGAAMGQAG